MKEKQTPRKEEGQPPTHEAKEPAKPLEQKADDQEGEGDRGPVRVGG